MFHRMFGRRKSPVTDELPTDPGGEETEERPDLVNSDGFIFIENDNQSNTYNPPPGYTVGGASAFLPYGLDARKTSANGTQRSISVEGHTAIDGIPFKLGSKVLLEGELQSCDVTSATDMIMKINSFNWDDYEYSFELERSILKEFNSTEKENLE